MFDGFWDGEDFIFTYGLPIVTGIVYADDIEIVNRIILPDGSEQVTLSSGLKLRRSGGAVLCPHINYSHMVGWDALK